MSWPALITKLAPGEIAKGLPLAEGPQALDGGGHVRPNLVVWRHEPGYGAPVASDRDLIASRHRVEQGSEMGFGLKRADGSRDGAHGESFNQLPTSL
jgi:hypothetical protein